MKVLEIKNNLVKIAYDAKDDLALSGFVIIEDENSPYVGQIMNLKADGNANYAIVKLLFTFNEEGILNNYNGTIPSSKAKVSRLPSSELLDIIPVDEPILFGKLAQQNTALKIDKSIFENNLLICSNKNDNTITLVDNIINQLDEKIVLFDTEGIFDFGKKLVFSKDFRLPLNYDTINFIYDNDLEDVDASCKAVIQDIFIEVQNYTKTLTEGFLPFETFFNVVAEQYKETQIPQLVLLKNKLLKYKDGNVFAETLKDLMYLNIAVEQNDITVIDISNLQDNLQKEVVRYCYVILNLMKDNIYTFININSDNADKKLLKKLLERNNVFTSIICPHGYKYLPELKQIAQNMILFAPLTMQHDFASYNAFLNKLNSDEFVIYGAHTQNIPLIVEADVVIEDEETAANVKLDDTEEIEPEEIIETSSENIVEQISVEQDEEISTSIEENFLDVDSQQNEDNIENETLIEEVISPEDTEIIEPDNIISEDIFTENLIEELPIEEPEIYEEPDIEIIKDNEDDNNDAIIEQVAQDVDRAFYEKLPAEEDIEINEVDELTEDDLNLIGDITSEYSSLENVLKEEPIVPIYPTKDEETVSQTFEPGDRVSTPKYGEGTVEKMIKYGNKMLCSIEFPNIGRRLLDPAMSEITKLS